MFTADIVLPQIISFSGPFFFLFWKVGLMGEGRPMEMGAGQGWAEPNARVPVGHCSFWEPPRTPSWGPQQGTGICGQCKTGPSAPLPLSSSCQHPPLTCPCTLWKWPTAAWPVTHGSPSDSSPKALCRLWPFKPYVFEVLLQLFQPSVWYKCPRQVVWDLLLLASYKRILPPAAHIERIALLT